MRTLLLALLLGITTNNLAQDTLPVEARVFDRQEVRCLAHAVYHEARGEPRSGQIAVARTIINRLTDDRFPNTICGVVYQKHQFTNISKTKIKNLNAWDKAKDVAYLTISQPAPTFTAKYFHSIDASPGWKKKKVAVIGRHIFYK